MPLVVLVDANTASAAEIVAGALKENGRATWLGSALSANTMQHVVELKTVQAGGLRVTWAKLMTPLNRDDAFRASCRISLWNAPRGRSTSNCTRVLDCCRDLASKWW